MDGAAWSSMYVGLHPGPAWVRERGGKGVGMSLFTPQIRGKCYVIVVATYYYESDGHLLAKERVWARCQVATPGESVDVAHIHESGGRSALDDRRISHPDPKRGRGVVENSAAAPRISSQQFVRLRHAEVGAMSDLRGDNCARTDRSTRVAWSEEVWLGSRAECGARGAEKR